MGNRKTIFHAKLSQYSTTGKAVGVKKCSPLLLTRSFTALLLSLLFTGCKPKSPELTTIEPLPQDPLIQVYFNSSEASSYTEPYREITRLGDDLEAVIIEEINQAQTSIDIAIQEFRLPQLAQALATQAEAGIKIRVILENTYSRPWSDLTPREVAQLDSDDQNQYREFVKLADINQDGQLSEDEINQRDALVILQNAQIPVIDDTADGSKGSGLMHHKFVVIDNYRLIVGSANFTTSGIHGDFYNPDSRGNANHLLTIQSRELAAQFSQEFNLMWGEGASSANRPQFGLQKPLRPAERVVVGNTPVSVQFSPTSPSELWTNSANGLIGKTLKTAQETTDLALFVFSDQLLANILQIQHQNGVEVRALIDRGFAYRYYSEGLDLLGLAIARECKTEPDNRPWRAKIETVGTPTLPIGDKLHHKFALIDQKTIITGSQNWSEAANLKNDETVLILTNPTVAAHFNREFQRLYRSASLTLPERISEQLARQTQECPQIEAQTDHPIRGKLVNLNTATPEELEALPGIGPTLAQRIIAFRQQQPFTSLEDLDRVRGVGPSLLRKLEGRVTW
ncbi:phospholipase D-like domain-containing protein [Roseofilum capinflatum]|uniref:phospholipase D n=1 Tax=Roseofilum capinflatum BLCC-M114 TaxID=3022440 RepID=A0ABT7B4R1_9CYAN|nr:phospholipase D-like domain-containing protein [Roseofilum capinflatum]MDJ1174167.1 phospholipase D-like domain-containing protein [Roseofilum capinflatum BLCC-M114]